MDGNPASSSCYLGLGLSADVGVHMTACAYFFGLQQKRRRSSGRIKCGSRTKGGKTEIISSEQSLVSKFGELVEAPACVVCLFSGS